MRTMNDTPTYLDWLMDIVGVGQNDPEYEVGEVLFNIPYQWRFELDKNYAISGLYLRKEYQSIYAIVDEDMRSDEVSVLEVLVELARRFPVLTEDTTPEEGYYEMTRNLGITPGQLGVIDENLITEIIFRWMEGDQDEHAVPGPFPVYECHKDPRTFDLALLFNTYISENHPHDPNWLRRS